MSLQANLTMNVLSVPAGQPAYATMTVYNPNAVPVLVTGIALNFKALGDALAGHTSVLPPSVPMLQGTASVVPALSAINIGPFPVVVPSSASANAFQTVGTIPASPNPQGSQPMSLTIVMGADVYASDGSVNTAGTVALIVSPVISSPAGFQGGVLQANVANNFVTFLAVM